MPYANGDYYLKDEYGNYWYYNASGALTSNRTEGIVCGHKTTDDGIVTGVPAGYTVAVTSILSGTSFRVEEVDLNSEKYDTPDKAVNNADASVVTDTDGHIADGSIKLGQDANVVVTILRRIRARNRIRHLSEYQKPLKVLRIPRSENLQMRNLHIRSR